ncbi:hypothetical protein D3C73_811880 [compost metagenome]
MPTTVDAAPVADDPKPPAALSAPDASACVVTTLLSETNGPPLPLAIVLTAESRPPMALPRFEWVAPCTP